MRTHARACLKVDLKVAKVIKAKLEREDSSLNFREKTAKGLISWHCGEMEYEIINEENLKTEG